MEFFEMCYILFRSLKFFPAIQFLVLSLCVLKFVPTVSLTNDTDKLALLEFKSLITNDPFEALSSWNQSSSLCHWFGATCGHKHQRVTALNLNHLNLRGTISPHIGNLSFLHSLDLGENFLSGKIPPQVGLLQRLQLLNLSNNNLLGSVPGNLSHCYNLVKLDLDHNNLTESIPNELGLLSNLEELYLYDNSLVGRFPISLVNLSRLTWLSVGDNYLEGEIPNAIAQMKSLIGFAVGVNNFSGVFTPLYNLSNLESISMVDNQFFGELRPDFGHWFPNIQVLDLGGNHFTGTIPSSISNASSLVTFDIGDNKLTGNIPMSYGNLMNLRWFSVNYNNLGTYGADPNEFGFLTPLANCSNLDWLDIGYNHYGGLFPSSIANLTTKMSWLLLGGNKIRGTIPPEISNLVGLTNLCVQDNLLTGSIPDSIGKLPKLTGLSLQLNKFEGQIPSSIGNLTMLSEFDLHGNHLEGNIPTNLANCQKLRILDLSDNRLNGTIPDKLVGLQSLSVMLNFSYNFLSGSLPLEVEKLIFLVALDFSNNNLTGELRSDTLGNCMSLETLYLQGNFFHGKIPDLARLKNIKFLDLSQNNFSGPIPLFLARSFALENLNLSMNNLEGEVPLEGVFKNASAVELFGNSKLCGGIKELHLRACHVRKHKHFPTKLIVLVVTLSLVAVFILSFILLWWRMWLKKPVLVSPFLPPFYPKVSYEELVKATNNFSEASCIGSGNFGTVYKGTLTEDREETIAVKVLKLQYRGAFKSFMAECQALRNIRHRNLVKVLTVCDSIDFNGDEFKALVYEFMPKGSLEWWLHPVEGIIAEKKLTLLERINIITDVASALQYLHHQCETPIIHCDIKPSNILLDNDMNAHVSDFGLARLVLKTGGENQFSSLGLKGTFGYAAPEYGMGEQVSTLGDVYSYGVLLLEVFTGKRPTDEMFKDDMNLHNFVKRALLAGHLTDIIDPSLLISEEMGEKVESSIDQEIDCLASLLKVGITCSAFVPRDRKNMREIVLILSSIRDKYLGIANAHQLTIQQLI